MEVAIGVIAGLAFGVVAFLAGRSSGRAAGLEAGQEDARREGLEAGRAEADKRIRATAEAVSRGRRPEGAAAGSAEEVLQEALESGWTPRDAERQIALREALSRVGAYLDRGVREPLAGASDGADAAELRERMARALGAIEDLDFFLQEPAGEAQGQDLQRLVQHVTHEFAQDQAVSLRLRLSDMPVWAAVNSAGLMDALYLVLHNAARFGVGGTVDVEVVGEPGRGVIRVRDRGPGFSEEAFSRAFDPFYSTSDEGLGLGLPHARKSIEAMGGKIELRNVPDGGAEVEITFPLA